MGLRFESLGSMFLLGGWNSGHAEYIILISLGFVEFMTPIWGL